MLDARLPQYAALLLDRCLRVQPRWQVLVFGTPLARPLLTEIFRGLARRGAYALPRIGFGGSRLFAGPWLAEAPDDLLDALPPIERYTVEHVDAVLTVDAPENTREGSEIPRERLARAEAAALPLLDRMGAHEIPWVLCQYPTPALAQEAGMSVEAFEDFLFGACLVDWDALGATMRRLADRLDEAEELRVVGAGTDLTIGVGGRRAIVSDGRRNMPDGEFFYSPVEDSAEGTISFEEFPAEYGGRVVRGIRLRFEGGRVVEADADSEADFLHRVLDTDDGSRRLGEVGLGCNPAITRHLLNTLFDEKMAGTVHLALGSSYAAAGGRNESAIHWDVVKDLRQGGRLYADGELVQADGAWTI